MPNYCQNVLEVTAKSKEARNKVKAALLGEHGEFSLNNTVPMPEGLIDVTVNSGVLGSGIPNWYDWSIEHWGTKWDVSDVTISDTSETSFSISFDTAWSPAEAWVEATSGLFPDVEFTLLYSEPGMEFSGLSKYLDGMLVADEHYDLISYDIVKQMGYSAEDFASEIAYSERLITRYVEDEDADFELIAAIVAAVDEMEEDEKPNGAILELARKRLTEGK